VFASSVEAVIFGVVGAGPHTFVKPSFDLSLLSGLRCRQI
jgi:hypothetical protein